MIYPIGLKFKSARFIQIMRDSWFRHSCFPPIKKVKWIFVFSSQCLPLLLVGPMDQIFTFILHASTKQNRVFLDVRTIVLGMERGGRRWGCGDDTETRRVRLVCDWEMIEPPAVIDPYARLTIGAAVWVPVVRREELRFEELSRVSCFVFHWQNTIDIYSAELVLFAQFQDDCLQSVHIGSAVHRTTFMAYNQTRLMGGCSGIITPKNKQLVAQSKVSMGPPNHELETDPELIKRYFLSLALLEYFMSQQAYIRMSLVDYSGEIKSKANRKIDEQMAEIEEDYRMVVAIMRKEHPGDVDRIPLHFGKSLQDLLGKTEATLQFERIKRITAENFKAGAYNMMGKCNYMLDEVQFRLKNGLTSLQWPKSLSESAILKLRSKYLEENAEYFENTLQKVKRDLKSCSDTAEFGKFFDQIVPEQELDSLRSHSKTHFMQQMERVLDEYYSFLGCF